MPLGLVQCPRRSDHLSTLLKVQVGALATSKLQWQQPSSQPAIMMDNPLLVSLALLLSGTLVSCYLWKKNSPSSRLPPGPPPLPILGNVLDIPSSEPWVAYKEWTGKYGDVFCIRLLTQTAIILNSLESAKALLEHRSQNYSSRPYLGAIDMLDANWNMAFLPYGDKWRLQRKVFQHPLRAEGVLAYRPMQLARARELVASMMRDPEGYKEHLEMHSTSIIMASMYDYHPAPRNDPMVNKIQTVARMFGLAVTPERSAVFSAFPWLMHVPSWVPGFSFQRTVAEVRALTAWWLDDPFEYTITKKSQGTLGPCVIEDALTRITDEDEAYARQEQQAVKEAAATSFAAATDTTASTLQVFILAMTIYPDVQKRAQREIESVVGTDRLPNFDDRPRLPYVEAVLRETLRWHPAVPLSLPHCNVSDDVYGGYVIPKGTTVIPNVWAMAHDETKYADPTRFDPGRFFDADGALNNDTVSYAFGFGRRVCIGRYLADASVWSAIVHLLASFTFRDPGADADDRRGARSGPRFTTGITSQPEPFRLEIIPRYDDEKVVLLLGEEE
ncbi:cytochrome P450 [Phlebopus sp. FC_14]|nr:cytochrome P450 [Phlebopus sp. FC_14]